MQINVAPSEGLTKLVILIGQAIQAQTMISPMAPDEAIAAIGMAGAFAIYNNPHKGAYPVARMRETLIANIDNTLSQLQSGRPQGILAPGNSGQIGLIKG